MTKLARKVDLSRAVAVRLFQVFLCAAYFAVLNWSYVTIECVAHGYYGFRFVPLPLGCQVWILVTALAPSSWLRARLERPSDVCLWILYLAAYLPAAFIPYHVLDRPWTSLTPFSAALCASMAALGWFSRLRRAKFPEVNISSRLIYSLLLLATLLLTLLAMVTSGGLSFDFSLEVAADRRLDARNAVQSGALVAYALATLSGALAPLSIVLGFVKRNAWFVGVGVLGLFSLFSFAGTKTDLFAPLYLFALYVLVRRRGKFFGPVIVVCASALVVMSVLQAELFGRQELALYVVSREMHLPGLLTSFYFDFFSDHAHVCYADGFLRWFVRSPYGASTPRMIGEVYFWGPDTNANANIWASAYANLGYAGIAITTAALGGLLYVIDSLAAIGEFVLIAAMCGYFGIAWSNVAFETSLLSNGILCCVAFFWLTPLSRATPRHAGSSAPIGLAGTGGGVASPSGRSFPVRARRSFGA